MRSAAFAITSPSSITLTPLNNAGLCTLQRVSRGEPHHDLRPPLRLQGVVEDAHPHPKYHSRGAAGEHRGVLQRARIVVLASDVTLWSLCLTLNCTPVDVEPSVVPEQIWADYSGYAMALSATLQAVAVNGSGSSTVYLVLSATGWRAASWITYRGQNGPGNSSTRAPPHSFSINNSVSGVDTTSSQNCFDSPMRPVQQRHADVSRRSRHPGFVRPAQQRAASSSTSERNQQRLCTPMRDPSHTVRPERHRIRVQQQLRAVRGGRVRRHSHGIYQARSSLGSVCSRCAGLLFVETISQSLTVGECIVRRVPFGVMSMRGC